jgi:hypothetical protein
LSWLTAGYGDRCAYVEKKLKKQESWKKAFKFVCTDAWILAAMKKCACGQYFRHEPLMDTDSLGKATGRKQEMQQSSSYPPALGVAIIKAWWSWRQSLLMPAQLSSKNKLSRGPAMGSQSRKRKLDDDDFVEDELQSNKILMNIVDQDFWQGDCMDNDFLM